jgi:hypothetical protein
MTDAKKLLLDLRAVIPDGEKSAAWMIRPVRAAFVWVSRRRRH